METTITVAGLVALVLPTLVDFVNAKIASSKVRFWIALVISVLVGGLSAWVTGQFHTNELLASIGVVFTLSQAVYKTYWEKSGLRAAIGLGKPSAS